MSYIVLVLFSTNILFYFPYNLFRRTLKSAGCPNFATRVRGQLATSDQECLCEIDCKLEERSRTGVKYLLRCWKPIFRIAPQTVVFGDSRDVLSKNPA